MMTVAPMPSELQLRTTADRRGLASCLRSLFRLASNAYANRRRHLKVSWWVRRFGFADDVEDEIMGRTTNADQRVVSLSQVRADVYVVRLKHCEAFALVLVWAHWHSQNSYPVLNLLNSQISGFSLWALSIFLT